MKNLFYLLVLIAFCVSCEEKMVVIPEFEPIETGKVMLVEELTGVRCPNCPAGSATLESISKELFPGNVIIVGIHGIDLAKPLDESKYDFRNDDAAALENYLKPFLGKPAAYFNRIKHEDLGGDFGNVFQGQWAALVEDELNKPQTVNLSIIKTYNSDTRVLDVTVSALPLETMTGEYKVSIMLTENKIIDAQDDQFEIVEDYEHNHVLRDIITNFDGDFLSNELEEGTIYKKQYTYTIPSDEDGLWVEDNVEVVAFIANTEGESEEILQAAVVHLKD